MIAPVSIAEPSDSKILRIKEAVAAEFGVTVEAIDGGARHPPLPTARHVAEALAVEMSGVSMAKLAPIFGCRNHRAIAYAVEQTKLRSRSSIFRARIDRIRRRISETTPITR